MKYYLFFQFFFLVEAIESFITNPSLSILSNLLICPIYNASFSAALRLRISPKFLIILMIAEANLTI